MKMISGSSLGHLLFATLIGIPLELQAETRSNTSASSPVAVKVTRPSRGEILRFVTLPGSVRAFQQATLYAKVGGYLKTIKVDKGDTVQAGELLAEIEAPELIADLAKFKAEAEVAKIEFDRVNAAQQKAPDLVVPQSIDIAKGKFLIAQANLERTETFLSFARLTAPFSGIVTMRFVDPGAFIPAATAGSTAQTAAVLTLMDFSKVRVQVAVPEPEVLFVARGQPVRVSVEGLGSRTIEGRITRLSYALDDATRTMLIEAELPNPSGELRPGMLANVKIGVQKHAEALLVPTEALVVEKVRTSVFTLVSGKAKKVPVKVGFEDGQLVEILDGVTASDSVILVGKLTLSDGQSVNPKEGN